MLEALSGTDGCILDDILPTKLSKYLATYKTLSSLPPLEPSFGPVDLTEPGKRQWQPSKSGYLNWAVGWLLVKGEAMDKVENSTMEIGSGVDLRRALDAVDVAKLRVNLSDKEKHQLERRFASLSAWLNLQWMPDILCFVPVPQLTKQKAAIKAALRLQELDHDIFYGLPSAESTITQNLASWLTTFHWWSVWNL